MAITTAEELRKARAKFIELRQDALERIGTSMQDELYDMIAERFLSDLQVSKGKIIYKGKNITSTDALEEIFKVFNSTQLERFALTFVSDIRKITKMNIDYYGNVTENLVRFKKVADDVQSLMRFRLGIDKNDNLIAGRFLDSFIRETSLKQKVASIITNAVNKGKSAGDLLKTLKQNIIGVPAKNIPGAVVSKLKNTIFDVYQQHDRLNSKLFATELKLKAFRYSGGLIDNSREFCIKRNDKIFTTDEAAEWVNDPDLPRTTVERKTGIITDYDPLIDCGRYRCRHHINFISNSYAKKLRPDLSDIL